MGLLLLCFPTNEPLMRIDQKKQGRFWKGSKIMKKFTSWKSWSYRTVRNHLSRFFPEYGYSRVSCLPSCANNPSTWMYSWNVRILESATQLRSLFILFIYKSALCKVLRGLAGELGYIGWHLLSRQLFPRWSRGSIDRNKYVAFRYF